jgi:hypothetical protein
MQPHPPHGAIGTAIAAGALLDAVPESIAIGLSMLGGGAGLTTVAGFLAAFALSKGVL